MLWHVTPRQEQTATLAIGTAPGVTRVVHPESTLPQDGASIVVATAMLTSIERLPLPAARAALPSRVFKRMLDVAVAGGMLIVAAPVLLLAAFAVLLFDRHRPFYRDTRIGEGARTFRCLKLRTMTMDPTILQRYFEANPGERDSYASTRKLKDDPRVTRLGRFLRRSSIDELPQLVNILRGEMSVVGPRPLAPAEFMQRGEHRYPLTLVRPGLTGLWQVRGRSDTTLRRRVRLDNFYATHWSLALDVRIILATPLAVIRARGAR